MKSIFKKFLFYILFIIGNIFLANTILSFFDPEQVMVKSYDPKYLFIMYPNQKGRVVSEEYDTLVSTNQYGFRQELKSDAEYKYLLLGDSFAEGWGVNENQSFASIANSNLSKNNQIRNLGIHGASTAFYALQLQNYINEFKPKTVLIQLFDNDLDDNDKLIRFMNMDETGIVISPKPDKMVQIFSSHISNFIKESTIYRLGKRIQGAILHQPNTILYYKPEKAPTIKQLSHNEAIAKFGGIQPLGDKISTKYGGQFEFYSDKNKILWEKRLANHLLYLNQILEICKRNKVELRLIYIPAKEFFAKDGITGAIANSNFESKMQANPHGKLLLNFCKINNILCYNTAESFFNQKPEDLYFPYDAHWNTKGHELFGKILSNSIQSEN